MGVTWQDITSFGTLASISQDDIWVLFNDMAHGETQSEAYHTNKNNKRLVNLSLKQLKYNTYFKAYTIHRKSS